MRARASGAAVWGSKLGAVVVPAASPTLAASINVINTLRMGVFFFLDATPHKLSARLVRFKAAAMRVRKFFAFVAECATPTNFYVWLSLSDQTAGP
jgi:hypothetical protein